MENGLYLKVMRTQVFFFLSLFILRERESERAHASEHGGGAERQEERENLKQVPSC